MPQTPADPLDGPQPRGEGVREDAPTLTGLPDDAPDELRATLSGGDLGHIPTEAELAEADRADAERAAARGTEGQR